MKKILIPMIEAGGGHKMPALAIKRAIEELYPGQFQIDVIDFAKECGAIWNDKLMKGFWDYALDHPELTTNLNTLLDALNHFTRSNTLMRLLFQQFIRKGTSYIYNYKPDIVFSTHFFCSSAALFAREKYNFSYKIYSYMTDPVRGHNMWINNRIEAVIAATEEAREYLLKQGQSKKAVKVMPFPLNKKFFEPISKSKREILEELGLDPDVKTVLATSGGQGIGETKDYIKYIYTNKLPFNIIAICGKNKELVEELETFKKTVSSPVKLAVMGFVDNMQDLLYASDLAIAKAGASTSLEVLVKNVPTIFTHCAALHEKGNIDFHVDNQMGWFAKNQKEFKVIIDKIITTDILEQYKANIQKNPYVAQLPEASNRLAKFIVEEIDRPFKKRRPTRKVYLRSIVFGVRLNIHRIRSRTEKYRLIHRGADPAKRRSLEPRRGREKRKNP